MNEVHNAGKVQIHDIALISYNGKYATLVSHLLEFNLYEDIFSGGMYGNVVLTDTRGIITELNMIGEEFITIDFESPGFKSRIRKSFQCTGVSNRTFTKDNHTEAFVIHFVSPEVFLDHYTVVQAAFSGAVDDVVSEIYRKHFHHPRYFYVKDDTLLQSEEFTELSIFSECKQKIKFVSPSWSPAKCLSWLASKVQPSDPNLSAPNFLFFESNRRFYWGSLEDIISVQRDSNTIAGIYYYAIGNVKSMPSDNTVTVDNRTYKAPDILRDYYIVNNLVIDKNVDSLANLQSGYLSSVYHELDVRTRTHKEHVYDHVIKYPDYKHTTPSAIGFFSTDTIRSPYSHQFVGFKHKELFTGYSDNLNERAAKVVPARNSLLNELHQVKMHIDVMGRTDVEIGCLIYLHYPKVGERTETEKVKDIADPLYSGLYLITAIHHRVTVENHFMTMEIVKDSLGNAK